jgi:hypothetical protein
MKSIVSIRPGTSVIGKMLFPARRHSLYFFQNPWLKKRVFSATFLGFKERALEIDVLTSGYPIMGKSLMTKAVIGRHMIAFAESLPPEKAEVVMAQNGEVDLRETAGLFRRDPGQIRQIVAIQTLLPRLHPCSFWIELCWGICKNPQIRTER